MTTPTVRYLAVFAAGALDQGQKHLPYFAFFSESPTIGEGIMAQTTTMAYLEQRYTALEREIADALHHHPTDHFAVADLKYRKSIIAGEIRHNRRLVERFACAS